METGNGRRFAIALAGMTLAGTAVGVVSCGSDAPSATETPDAAPAPRSDASGGVDGTAGDAPSGDAADAPSEAGEHDAAADAGGPSAPPTFVPATWVRAVAGETVGVAVNVLPGLHLSGPVDVSVSGLPSGVTADPLTIPAGTESGTLTLHVASSATTGDSQPTVTATAGSAQHAEAFKLLVQGAPGTLDTSFGTGGILDTGLPPAGVVATVPLLAWVSQVFGVSVESDASLLVWGQGTHIGNYAIAGNDCWVMHLSSDGRPDPSFGAVPPVMSGLPQSPPGYAFPQFGTWTTQIACVGLAQLAGGRIALSGEIDQTSGPALGYRPFVAELASNGSLDPAFAAPGDAGPDAGGGARVLDLSLADGGVMNTAFGLAFDGNASFILPFTSGAPSLVRLRASDGTVDPSFGDAGFVGLDCVGCGTTIVATYDPSGRVVAALSGVVQRFTPAGAPDPSFGASGTTKLPIPVWRPALAVGQDGSIVVVGGSTGNMSVPPSPNTLAMARLRPDGSLDPAFGNGGTLVTSLGAGPSYATDVAVLDDGSFVVAARIQSATGSAVSVARFTRAGALDASFAGGAGFVTIEPSDTGYGGGRVTVMPDGRILLAGMRCAPESSPSSCNVEALVLARYWP